MGDFGLNGYRHSYDSFPMGAITSFTGGEAFLSNSWPSPVKYGKLTFPCAEAAYQAQKCAFPEDMLLFEGLDGKAAKLAGHRVDLRDDWQDVRIRHMYAILQAKFAPGTPLADKLIGTEGMALVNADNRYDTFWGVDPATNKGDNMLGNALMMIRHSLVSKAPPELIERCTYERRCKERRIP